MRRLNLIEFPPLSFAGPCVTEDGKKKCTFIRKKLFLALEKLLRKRLGEHEAHSILTIIREFTYKFNEGCRLYGAEWDTKFLSRPNVKWPKFITDLMLSQTTQEADLSISNAQAPQAPNVSKSDGEEDEMVLQQL